MVKYYLNSLSFLAICVSNLFLADCRYSVSHTTLSTGCILRENPELRQIVEIQIHKQGPLQDKRELTP